MMETYAALIVNGLVEQVIVGDAIWATESLGGDWVDSDMLVGIGWLWDGHHFVPPVESDEPSEEVDG